MLFQKQIINMYKGLAYTRCDDDGTAFYFSSDDFECMKKEAYSFKSSMGHTLKGYFYCYDDPVEKRLIVFEHGFGGGHRSYMKEIDMLCRHGYLVFAYDHSGCMESGGETPNGMAQSLCDLNDCIEKIKSDERFRDFDISVVGHSWGGFSTMNIPALHSEISHVVVISGFVSVELLVKSYFSGILKAYRKPIMELEKAANPRFSQFNGVESLASSSVSLKALLIYSDNDTMCKIEHYNTLKKDLSEKSNVDFLLVKNRGHNPNYTEDAVKYLSEYITKKTKLLRQKKLISEGQKRSFLDSFDWHKMTAQDEAVWDKIFACLDN